MNDLKTDRIAALDTQRRQVEKEIAALQARRADLSIKITQAWQDDLVFIESQPESESLTGSAQPD